MCTWACVYRFLTWSVYFHLGPLQYTLSTAIARPIIVKEEWLKCFFASVCATLLYIKKLVFHPFIVAQRSLIAHYIYIYIYTVLGIKETCYTVSHFFLCCWCFCFLFVLLTTFGSYMYKTKRKRRRQPCEICFVSKAHAAIELVSNKQKKT